MGIAGPAFQWAAVGASVLVLTCLILVKRHTYRRRPRVRDQQLADRARETRVAVFNCPKMSCSPAVNETPFEAPGSISTACRSTSDSTDTGSHGMSTETDRPNCGRETRDDPVRHYSSVPP
jgi:heme exporter protein D